MFFVGFKTYEDWLNNNSYVESNRISNVKEGIKEGKVYQKLENYYRVDVNHLSVGLKRVVSIINGKVLRPIDVPFVDSDLTEFTKALEENGLLENWKIEFLEILPNFEKGTFFVNIISGKDFSLVRRLKLNEQLISMVSEVLHIFMDFESKSVERIIIEKRLSSYYFYHEEKEEDK